MPRGAAHTQWGKVAEPSPLAVVERNERTKQVRGWGVRLGGRTACVCGALHLLCCLLSNGCCISALRHHLMCCQSAVGD